MARYSDTLRDERRLSPVAGAQIFVLNQDGSTPVITDDSGDVIFYAVSDQYGKYAFNVADNFYELRIIYRGRVVLEISGLSIGSPLIPFSSVVDALGTSPTLAPSQRVVKASIDAVTSGAGAINAAVLGFSTSASPSNNLTALNQALATGLNVILPAGIFRIGGASTPLGGHPGQKIVGAGREFTTLMNTTANTTTVSTLPYAQGCCIEDLTLDREVTATLGGNGVTTGASGNFNALRRITSKHNYNGFELHSAAWGDIDDCLGIYNTNHGCAMPANAGDIASGGGMQWNFSGQCLFQQNAVDGFNVDTSLVAASPAGQIILNPINNMYTFANGRDGVHLQGTAAHPIQDVQFKGGFLSTDTRYGLYSDSYGTGATIGFDFIELTGDDGVHITMNVTGEVSVKGGDISASGRRGVYCAPPSSYVSNVKVYDSGQKVYTAGVLNSGYTAQDSAGIVLGSSRSSVVGGCAKRAQYGVIALGGLTKIVGVDASTNITSAISGQTDTEVVGCITT